MKIKLVDIRNAVTSRAGRQLLTAQKHSPVALFVAGAVGIVATVVLASRATLKLEDVLEETKKKLLDVDHVLNLDSVSEDEYSTHDATRDRALIYAKAAGQITRIYLPAIGVGILSICALTGSHIILSRRNVALTAAYAAIDQSFRDYRERVVGEYGRDKDREFLHGDPDQQAYMVDKKGKRVGKDGRALYSAFFDEGSRNWSKVNSYNQMFLRAQQNYANDLLKARGYVFLNEVRRMLGLDDKPEGQLVGWVLNGDGDGYVDFGVFEGDVYSALRFVNGDERSILLDFNVDGIMWDKI